jgi:hypothetical protein
LLFFLGELGGADPYRRRCSHAYQLHNFTPPPCKLFGRSLGTPCICVSSNAALFGGIAGFIVAGFLVFFGGLKVIG